MRNKCDISFDGVCVYVSSTVKPVLLGRIILVIINLLVWPVYITLATTIPENEVKSFIIPLIIILLLLIFILGRYSVWNFWGRENITISTKAITFNRSYGIIETNQKVIKLNRLMYSFEHIKTFEDQKYGRIHFFDYDKNNIPIEIFETSILMPEFKANEIFKKINELFEIEYFEKERIIPYTLN